MGVNSPSPWSTSEGFPRRLICTNEGARNGVNSIDKMTSVDYLCLPPMVLNRGVDEDQGEVCVG